MSKQPMNKEEKLGKYAKEIVIANKNWESNYTKFQFTIGAKIRGELGIDKGNAFIKAVREATRQLDMYEYNPMDGLLGVTKKERKRC